MPRDSAFIRTGGDNDDPPRDERNPARAWGIYLYGKFRETVHKANHQPLIQYTRRLVSNFPQIKLDSLLLSGPDVIRDFLLYNRARARQPAESMVREFLTGLCVQRI